MNQILNNCRIIIYETGFEEVQLDEIQFEESSQAEVFSQIMGKEKEKSIFDVFKSSKKEKKM